MGIWKIKLTGKSQHSRGVSFSSWGEPSIGKGMGVFTMVGIIDNWHEKLKPNETPLKLEEINKEREKQGDDQPLTAEGEARYRRVLGQLAWAALSRADLYFFVSYLARFQSKPTGAAEACLRAMLRWLLTRLPRVHFSGRIAKRRTANRCCFCDASWNVASVSSGVLMFQGCCMKVFHRKQECPALSASYTVR